MSLRQLLAVGHSFVGIKDTPSRYKLQENWLPRFGPASAAPVVPVASPGVAVVVLPVSPTSVEPALAPQPRAAISLAPRAPGREGPTASGSPGVAARVSRGRRRRWSGLRASVEARFKKRTAEPLRHPELSLDRVQVVRNDLSDADLEIVPAAGDVRAAEAPSRRLPATLAPAAGPGWGGLAARLFQAGRGLF